MMASPADESGEGDGDGDGLRSREEVLAMMNDVLSEAHRKVEHGRVYDAEKERVRQGWIRVFAYAAGQYRQMKRDEDLDELQERVDALASESSTLGDEDLDELLERVNAAAGAVAADGEGA